MTVDCTNPNKLCLRDMTDAQIATIVRYFIHNKVEEYIENKWYTGDEILPDNIYRIAPTKLSVNWDHLADWVVCIALDSNGAAWCYDSVPTLSKTNWIGDCMGMGYKINFLSSYQRGTCDWRESLVFRPGKEPK